MQSLEMICMQTLEVRVYAKPRLKGLLKVRGEALPFDEKKPLIFDSITERVKWLM